MPFQLSPGIAIVEKDLTSIVPAVSTSNGAYAGAFQWGPVMDPTIVSSENDLVQRFGKPNDSVAQSFFTAANFLAYSNSLLVARADTTNQRNAVAFLTGTVSSVTMSTAGVGYTSQPTVTFSTPDADGGVVATGTAVRSGGTVLTAAVSNGGTSYTTPPTITFSAPQVAGGTTATGSVTIDTTVGSPTLGQVIAIVIEEGGSGYTTAPTITFNNVGTGGSNAAAGTVTISASTITAITIVNPGTGYATNPTVTVSGGGASTQATALAAISTTAGIKIKNSDDYETNFVNGSALNGEFAAKYPGSLGNSLRISIADSASFAAWAYRDEFDTAPGTSEYAATVGGSNDELHIIVIDEDGVWTGSRGSILEKYSYVSKASDARKADGSNNYYKNVLNTRSKYIWWLDHPVLSTSGAAWGSEANASVFKSATTAVSRSLVGGVDDYAVTDGNLQNAWALFADESLYDISLLPMGKVSSTVALYIINSVAETRRDCVAFASPVSVANEVIIGSGSDATDQIIAYRNELTSSSYAVMDSGFKYQYDRYNDKYRWVPLNGDVAGLCARADFTNDPWFSPGGLNRGQIKNVVKLSHNPNKTDRDNLYKNGVNPVVNFPGQGTVLFGDKTMLAKPSAFDRINVRRLFIVLEKAIATASKYQLFEFNDSFTRAQFKNLVEPFLRDVQGRRGITEFLVKCDESNNTSQVIDSNEFVADIYVKPNRAINFITLNFIATRSGISFSEIAGA